MSKLGFALQSQSSVMDRGSMLGLSLAVACSNTSVSEKLPVKQMKWYLVSADIDTGLLCVSHLEMLNQKHILFYPLLYSLFSPP